MGALVSPWSPWPMLRNSHCTRVMQQPIRTIAENLVPPQCLQWPADHVFIAADDVGAAVETRQFGVGVDPVDLHGLSAGGQPPGEVGLCRAQACLLPVQDTDNLTGVIEDRVGQSGVAPAHRQFGLLGRPVPIEPVEGFGDQCGDLFVGGPVDVFAPPGKLGIVADALRAFLPGQLLNRNPLQGNERLRKESCTRRCTPTPAPCSQPREA